MVTRPVLTRARSGDLLYGALMVLFGLGAVPFVVHCIVWRDVVSLVVAIGLEVGVVFMFLRTRRQIRRAGRAAR